MFSIARARVGSSDHGSAPLQVGTRVHVAAAWAKVARLFGKVGGGGGEGDQALVAHVADVEIVGDALLYSVEVYLPTSGGGEDDAMNPILARRVVHGVPASALRPCLPNSSAVDLVTIIGRPGATMCSVLLAVVYSPSGPCR